MKALQMIISDGLRNTCWNSGNKSIALSTLVEIILIWFSKGQFKSKPSSKSFRESPL